MYLYLAYFLRYGEWYQAADSTQRNIVNEKTFPSWNVFYNHTNSLLRPHELCDSFRRAATTNANLKIVRENHYFHDAAERDNVLVYIQAFKHLFPTHGTQDTSTILDRIPNATFFVNVRSAATISNFTHMVLQ